MSPPAQLAPAGVPVVVVDSTAIVQTQGELTRGAWPAVLAAARLGAIELALPEVVLRETVDHRRRDLEAFSKASEALERDRVRLFKTEAKPLLRDEFQGKRDSQIGRLLSAYTEELTTFFTQHGQVRGYPAVSHDELVRRVLAGRKPFNVGEKGYRDALIWYTMLELAVDHDVILLSGNTRDFGEGAALASDLEADLNEAGLPLTRVTLCTSTTELLQRVLPPTWSEDRLAAAWASFATGAQFTRSLSAWFEDNGSVPFRTRPSFFPATMWETDIEGIERVEETTLLAAVDDGDGWYQVAAHLHGVAHPGGMIWNRPWTWAEVPEGEFELWSEFGEHQDYLRTVAEHRVDVQINLRFRPPNEVENLRLDTVDTVGEAAQPRAQPRSLDSRLAVLLEEASDLLRLAAEEPDVYAQLVSHDNYVLSVAATLDDLARHGGNIPPTLVPDNLGTVLQDPAGIAAFRRDLATAIRSRRASS